MTFIKRTKQQKQGIEKQMLKKCSKKRKRRNKLRKGIRRKNKERD